MNLNLEKPIYLIGAGGHCKVLVDILHLRGATIAGYYDFKTSAWLKELGIHKIKDEDSLNKLCKEKHQLCVAFLGRNIEDLKRRYVQMHECQKRGASFPAIIHPHSIISPKAVIGQGVQILAGSIVNACAVIKEGAVLNTASIVEHDAIIGPGSHLAPRATVLGAASVGDNSFVGSGSVIIQGRHVKKESFLKAGLIYSEGNI
jgi:sugar O-acyltransferase (sialic acid O-acetyltransferase NeuD family)